MILQIKRGNKVVAESADFSYSPSLQEVRKLTCEVVSVVPIEFKTYNSKSESEYDTVVYNGNTFILYQAPSGDNLNEAGKYKYSLLFYGKEVLLQNVAFLDIVSGTGGEINKIRYTHGGLFQFWGDAKQLAARIEANIESYNASLGAGYTGIGTWTLNVDAEGELTEDMIDITDGTNLFEALKNFYDKFYLNYYFSTTANGGIITITDKTRPSVNWTFKQGDGGGAVKVSSSVDTSTPVITRIIPQGGSRNVPPEYKKDAKPADESRYCPYILLPNDSDGNIRYYIDSEYGLKNYGVRGKTISNTFSGIYPSIRGKKLGDLYPSGLPEWDTYKADGEPDPQSGKVAGEGASASTRIDKIIGSTPIKSDDSDSFFIYMTSPGFNLGYKVYEDGDSSDKINDNVQPQYKPHAMFDKYRDFESFDIYGTRAYYDQPVKATASFSGKMLFSILPIGSDAVGKKVKINLRMVLNRVLGQASPLKEVVIGEEGATGMLEIPYDKTALVGYIEKGQNTTVTIRVEFTFDSDIPAESCKIGFSEEMTCNIHFGNQDGSQDRFYYKYASVTDAVFSMRTGTYTGTEFKINKNGIIPLYGEVNGDTGETEEDVAMFNKGARYKISCYRTDSDNAKLPLYTDGKSPSIAAGTEFVILNIVMPESYVTMAENTLEKAALDYLSRYDHENRTVSLDISSGFVAEHPNLFIDFIEGNMIKVRDDGIGVFDFSDNGQIVDMQLQIQSLEIKYSKENMFPSYSCTIARRKILSFYERLAQENQTASTQNTTNVTLGGSGTGSGTGSGGGSSNITNADHAKSAYTLDDDTPVLNWFLSALNDDEAEGIINFLKGLKISGNLINRIVKQGDRDVTYTDEDVMSALRVMVEIENSVEKMKEIFLRKDVADSTKFLLSMFAGAVFGKNGFASGLTGFGAKIFDTGHGEFESMFIRRFLEVPELRYNRVMVTLGDKWRAPGAGIIETVDTGTKTCTLKLEDGEIGAVAVGDICMGIYHNITGNATEDYDDGKGNRRFAGFCTVYFTITEVTGERNETFKYQLRPTSSSWPSSFDPFEMMTFVAYGSFTNTERQTSVYETRTYTRMLWKQNTWEISASNVALQYGDLSNLNIFGLNMDGYSMYLNNIYMTGIIKQIKPDGTPVQTLNFREEGYIPGVHYDYYDSLSYNGSMWACINEDGSSAAPGSNGDWLEIASKGDTGEKGDKGDDGEKGDKGDKGDQGVQGIQGCIIRSSEWKTGVTYRNDESLTSGTRYIDIVAKKNTSPSSLYGWDMYMCKSTHTSSSSNGPGNTTYWTAVNEMAPIFTSLIIAKNASIDFVQGNELIIKDSNNNVVAGLTGGSSKEAGTTPVRIWAGGNVPGNAPFRVDQNGNLVATKANITGTITATGGNIGGFNISTSSMESVSGNNAMLLSANLVRFTGSYSSVFIGADTFPSSSGGAILCPSRISVNRNITNTAYGNVGMYFDIQGSHAYDDNDFQYTGNHALYIVKGDICGFRLRLRRISKSTTLSVMDSVIMAVTSGITLTVPSTAEDGQFYWIRNVSGGDVTIAGTNLVCWNSGEVSTSIGLAKSKAAAMYYDKHNNKWFMNWIDCWN